MLEKSSFLSFSKKRLPNVYQFKIKHSGECFHALTPDKLSARRRDFCGGLNNYIIL